MAAAPAAGLPPFRAPERGRRPPPSLALLALTMALVGCPASSSLSDGGMGTDVPTIEGGTLRPDALTEDAPVADAAASDAGPSCAGACDPRATRGCGGTSTCSLAAGVPMCVPTSGTGLRGSECSAPEDCGHGLGCFRDRTSGLGACEPVCCPADGVGCEVGERCGGAGELVGGERTAWGQCAPPRACDVLAPLACTEREGCYIVDAAGATECRIAGAAMPGEGCELPEDCGPGLFCGGLGARTCLVVCELAAVRACPDLSRCVAQSYSPGGTGVCVREPGTP